MQISRGGSLVLTDTFFLFFLHFLSLFFLVSNKAHAKPHCGTFLGPSMVAQNGTPSPLLKDKRTNAAIGQSLYSSLCQPHLATRCNQNQSKVAACKRNEIKAQRRIRKVGKAPSAASVAVAVAVAIVSAMIAKSNSPKRCGTKRGNIFYA